MKKLMALSLVALAAVAIYSATATGGAQAPPSRGEFNALKARTAKLEKRATQLETLIGACFTTALPVSRYSGYVYQNSSGAVFLTTALDLTEQGQTPNAYALDVGAECANAINSTYGLHHFQIGKLTTAALKRH
jgi:hypothetical protein